MKNKILIVISALMTSPFGHSSMVDLKNTAWEKYAKICDIDPLLLYAIALKESSHRIGSGSFVAPYKYALNNPVLGSYYPKNKAEAVRKVNEFVKVSNLTDIGITQINWKWNGSRYVSTPSELLDLDKNIEVSAKILCAAIALSPNDIAQAIGNYHTPNPAMRKKSKAYGESVLLIWQRLNSYE